MIYWLTREWVNLHRCKPTCYISLSITLIYLCLLISTLNSKIYTLQIQDKNAFQSPIKKDRKVNGESNLLILTWRLLDNFALEGEACRANPAETCACACKSACTLFSHCAVRFLSMWPLTNAWSFTNPFNALSALLA